MQMCLKSASQFKRYGAHKHFLHTSTFWLKFGSLSPAVTLKIMSRSPKPNQHVIMSQCYIHANLVKIHPSVHERSYIQESATPIPTPTWSAPKTKCPPQKTCPPLLRWVRTAKEVTVITLTFEQTGFTTNQCIQNFSELSSQTEWQTE